MRKGTKKKVIHGILIIIVIIFALLASLVAAFRDVTLQTMVARSLAGELSKRLNADVKIRTFYVTKNLKICVEDVQINDLEGYPLFEIGKMNAKLSPMVGLNDIRIKDVYFQDVLGWIVKYDGNEKINVSELFSQLGGEKNHKKEENEDSDFRLRVDNLRLDNGHVVFWNQNKDKPEKLSMDYAHIDIDSIYGVFSDLEIRNDSIFGNVHTLSGKDKCGLTLDDLSGNVLFCSKCLNIDNLLLKTNESYLDLDLRFEYNNTLAYDYFVDSVRIIGNIRPTTLLLSDLKYFAWIMRKMPDKFFFTAYYDGYVRDFSVNNFDAYFGENSHIDADISFKGLPDFEKTYISGDLRKLNSSYEELKNFAIPSESVTVPLPEMLADMGRLSLSGSYSGFANDFLTNFSLISEMGDIDANIYLNTTENSEYSFDIVGNRLNIKDLINAKDESEVSFELNMKGGGVAMEDIDFEADLHLNSLKISGNEFNDFNIHGDFENQKLIAFTNIKHPYIDLKLSSMVDFKGKMPSYNVIAKIQDADLVKLNLLDNDTIMLLSSSVDLEFTGNDIDNITGRLDIEKTSYYNGTYYAMKNFVANVSEKSGIKEVNIDCDFFNFFCSGIINLKTFANAMKNTAQRYVNVPVWFKNNVPDTHKQEFSLSLNFKDTGTLSKLFVPELYVSSGTTVNATYTDGYAYHGSTVESPEIRFNNLCIKNLDIRNTAKFDEFTSKISLEDVIIRDSSETNPKPVGLENILLVTKFSNDTVKMDFRWDDDSKADHNKAHIKSMFVPGATSGGFLTVMSEEIVVNDTVWCLNPECNLDFQSDKVVINNLDIYTDTQSISLYGTYPKYDSDTLYAVFENVDVSDFDVIIPGIFNLDGIIDGTVGVSGVDETFSFSSNLEVKRLFLNNQEVGDVFIKAKWHDEDKSIFINTEIFNSLFGKEQHESVCLIGKYFPKKKKNNLDFDLKFDDFKLETVSPFISKVVKRMNGYASGNVKIGGSFDEPVVVGKVGMIHAGCLVNYLNTYYQFSDTINLYKDKISLNNIVINDTIGNKAVVNGVINHSCFKDFNFDLSIRCYDFLAMNIPADNANGFYGSAVADGVVMINGPVNDITMNINALTKRGTEIDIPLSGTSTMNNDFIVFVRNDSESDTVVEKYVPEVEKDKNKFTMNLNAEVNTDAALNIFLPQNMGNINAKGNGNINIGLDGDDFSLRGDYVINSGSFVFTLEMVKRTFTLRDGGMLRWTGDPADADINVVGVYRTKSSLTSLGTQAVDSTALTNNINVDCIIRLSDKLTNPTITFGIELPNAKEDTQNLVYSIIDTTNQAVMAQQVFSLMVLGSFSYTAGSNVTRLGTTTYYSVITSQLSNWLSQISKDFDIGINYTPNDQLTNEEIEVALSTQLFNDRLTIEGNFGVIRGDRSEANNANNIVGDVDLTFRLTKRWSLKAYNHTNIKNNYYLYSFENYSDFTQGIGISFSQSFNNVREIFNLNKKNKSKKNKNKENEIPKSE